MEVILLETGSTKQTQTTILLVDNNLLDASIVKAI